MRISILMQTTLAFLISQYFVTVLAAPQDHRIEYRTAYSVSQLKNERQLQGTLGVTLPQSENGGSVSAAKDLGSYGMSTPSYETLESQLQSPHLAMKIPTRTLRI